MAEGSTYVAVSLLLFFLKVENVNTASCYIDAQPLGYVPVQK